MKKKAVEYKLKAEKQDFSIVKVQSSEDAYKFSKNFYFDDINIYESTFLIMINQANNVTGYAKISQGGIASTVVDARLVAKFAIDSLAAGVIMVHNHPSGNVRPSGLDDRLTEQVRQGLALFGIKLLDHIIVSEDSYYSYSDEGRN